MCNCLKEKETNVVKSIMLFQTNGWPDWVASDVLKHQMNMMNRKSRNPPLRRKNMKKIIDSDDSVERKRKEKYLERRRKDIFVAITSTSFSKPVARIYLFLGGCGSQNLDFWNFHHYENPILCPKNDLLADLDWCVVAAGSGNLCKMSECLIKISGSSFSSSNGDCLHILCHQ